jgi:SSS family transporter
VQQVLAIDWIIIGGYLALIMAMGAVFSRFNRDDADYFRGGSKGVWWLVGASAFMSGFSAYTFTAASGVAFEAGWSVVVIYFANAFGYLLNFLFLAPWFRQIRATTGPEVTKERYGLKTQQFYAWIGVVMSLLMAGIWLNGLAIFTATVFGLNVKVVIIVVGIVVLFYSMSGGVWAVMGTDFLQSLILIPITILMAYLCLKALGGFGGMIDAIESQGLTTDFKLFNEPGRFIDSRCTWLWAVAIVIKNVTAHNTLGSAAKYFTVKDGREARMAAAMAGILMVLGAIVWIIPPMASRLLFADQVLAVEVSRPTESAYAIAALNLLPRGMLGLMVVAMLAATMSSMDTGLNRNAAVFVRDILPNIFKLFGRKPVDTKTAMKFGKIYTAIFGLCIIGLALYFEAQKGKGVFAWMLGIGAVIGVPMSIPMLMGLFVKRAPAWSAMVTVILTMIPSMIGVFSKELFGEPWVFQTKLLVNLAAGVTIFLLTIPFARTSSDAYHEKVAAFFKRMKTPIDLEKEVGELSDGKQLVIMGRFAMTAGALITLLCLAVDTSKGEHWAVLFVAGTVISVGSMLNFAGMRYNTKAKHIIAQRKQDVEAACATETAS